MPFFIGATGLGTGLIVSSLLLGLQHGVDWDHIAAITDIAATQDSPRRGFAIRIIYAFGHGLVVGSLSPLGGVNRRSRLVGGPSVSERIQRAGHLTPNS